LAQVFLILFWYLFHRFMGERLSRTCGMLDQRSWLLLTVICLASLTAVISLISFQLSSTVESVVYLCMVACIVTNFGTICLATRLADTILADMERRNLQLQKSYYEELDQNQQQIRKIRHDMNNHLSVIEGLLKKGDIQNALEYFEDLAGHVRTGTRRFCKDSIVNAVLNTKYTAAEDAAIDSFFHVDIDKILGIDAVSLCTIFSNTLDNAIEACLKIPETEKRHLSLKARYTDNGYFSYEIVNSKRNEVKKKKDAFLTDKEDARSHGLGIVSVRDVVRRYDGTLDITYTEDEFRIVILIKAK
ncbi:MAG TPA: GHKL domain-containing protein, partial [Candidatus Mediterraneibacter norfolkensis]|nr:GHKL domain-containing protein [Candidatus Mediterraneibacter norfolkensis]